MQQGPSSGQTDASGTTVRFGDLLRALRETAGLTQEELAERAGLTSHAVSALERGARARPYPHTVRSLAAGLGLDDDARTELLAAVPRRASGQPGPPERGEQPLPAPERRTTMSVPSTPLHGRADDIEAVIALVRHRQRRLVTLTGLGGIGKTRLAAAVADRLRPDYPDGVVLVPLAHVTQPERLLPEIAGALGVIGADAPSGAATLFEHLCPLRMVLVLDNVEQVLAAAQEVADLVAAAPDVTVLATSRAPLRVRSESEYPVAPLATPAVGMDDLDALAETSAGAMFLERARAIVPELALSGADVAAIAALCRRLSGIPLALELAAAHLRLLEPPALLGRLDDLMGRAGSRDLPARQRSMQVALEWSRELLSEDQQRLLRRLSVFRGGWTLEAAEAVCAELGGEHLDVLESLSVLVEHSLVVVSPAPGGGRRYSMLEPVAQYAAGLLSADEAGELGQRHAHYYLGLAIEAAPAYTGAEQIEWLARIEREDPNFTAALSRSLSAADVETCARLGWGLWLYWWLRGRLQHGRQAMEEVLEHELSDEAEARACLTLGAMTFAQADLAASAPAWQRAHAAAQRSGEARTLVSATAGIGLVALARGDLDLAERQFTEALALASEGGWVGEWVGALAEIWLGTVRLARGDVDQAVTHLEIGLASAQARGDRLTAYVALFNLSQAALARGNRDAARTHLLEGVRLSAETRDAANLAYVVEALAVLESAEDRPERVAVLSGAAEAMRALAGGSVYGYYLPDPTQLEAAAGAAREALGSDTYEGFLVHGRAMRLDDVVAYVPASDPG